MRRLVLILALAVVLTAASGTPSASQDAVSALLAELQSSLARGNVETFVRSAAPLLPAEQRQWLSSLATPGQVESVTVRERSRSAAGVAADVFVSYGSRGFVSSWWMELDSRDGRVTVRTITEVSQFSGLLRLALHPMRQFAAQDLTITGPDFTARVAHGTVHVAEVSGETTALVIRGRAQIQFTPGDAAEQGQLKLFGGANTLAMTTDELFVRVNPSELERHVTWRRFDPVATDAEALARARAVFDARATASYHFDLTDLSTERWSVEPSPGSVLVDFRAGRHGWLTYVRSPEDPEDVSVIDRARRRQISLYTSRGHAAEVPDEPFDILHTNIDLSFDPARLWLSGRASITLVIRRPTSSFGLKLGDTLVISSITSPELGSLLPLRTSGFDSFLVAVPAGLEAGRVVTLDVQYHGRVEPDDLNQEALEVTAFPQEPAASLEFPIEPRFLYSTRAWWYPQSPRHRHSTAALRITVPAEYYVLGTGQLVDTALSHTIERRNGDLAPVRSFSYRTDRPVRYLAFLVSRLQSVGRAQARVPVPVSDAPALRADEPLVVAVEVMAPPGASSHTRATPARVASMVEFYARLLGGAPYASLTIAALENTQPGGHSPAYFALLNQPHPASTLSWAQDPVVFPDAPDFFLAHEVAHQWWGQAVGGATYRDQWISEGLAHYLAWMYVDSTHRPEIGARIMSRMRETAIGLTAEGPIHLGFRLGHLRGDRRIFRSVVYNKSAVVMHMLRRLVGDESFFSGLKQLYAASRFRSIGVGEVERAFQGATALPLARFFNTWVREAVVPAVRLSWSADTAGGIAITAHQLNAPVDLPYDATIHYVDGTREQTTLHLSKASEVFPRPTRGPVRRVTFDDELTLVRVVR